MRVIFYLISYILILFSFSSCSKGGIIKDPQFGSISITDRTTANIKVIQGADSEFPLSGKNASTDANVNLVSGKNRFRFYEANLLLLDTSFLVEAFVLHPYFMFRPDRSSALKIVDAKLNNFDKEQNPDSGSIKISLANFSKSLPDKVNIYVSTTTYIPYTNQPIQVGTFLNTSGSFSEFKKLILGKDQFSKLVDKFTLTIKDPANNTVLSTTALTLPVEAKGVYLLYLADDDKSTPSATILMSK